MNCSDCEPAMRRRTLTPVKPSRPVACRRTARVHPGKASNAMSDMSAMSAVIAAFCLLTVPPAIPAAHGAESSADERARHERVAAALVEVHTHADEPDLYSPWQSLGIER